MTLPTRPFNVHLTHDQVAMLTRLAEHKAISRAAVLRQLIQFCYNHTFKGVPTCATGAPCFVPQMHQLTHAVTSQSEPLEAVPHA